MHMLQGSELLLDYIKRASLEQEIIWESCRAIFFVNIQLSLVLEGKGLWFRGCSSGAVVGLSNTSHWNETLIAGTTSTWKALSPEMLQASFIVTHEAEKSFRSKRMNSEIFFASSK
ncbi:hypothetical protein Tco_1561159 [Tanacetum coccineum]